MAVALDIEQIRDVLDVRAVMDAYALTGALRNGWYRLGQCPRCGEKSSREAIAIEARTGRWLHHGLERGAGGECSGDVYDLIAACNGLDSRVDFIRIKQIAAGLAGLSQAQPVNDEIAQRRRKQRETEELAAAAAREAAAEDAAAAWPELQRRHLTGELYLANRGLDVHELIRREAVRFSSDGDPCVALYSRTGSITSIATRHVDPMRVPKVLVRKGTTTTGTFIDSVDRIHGNAVVLVEGVVDALTARLAWPDATVLGANGAGNVPKIARAAVARIRLTHAPLYLVPHHDDQGIKATATAAGTALGAGLELGRDLHVLALPQPDLNAAWAAGWRP